MPSDESPTAAPTGSTLSEYRHDPIGFIHDCFIWPDNEHPTAYQIEIIEQLLSRGRASVRGPHGLGKTALSAWVILWYALTRDGEDWKVVTTASAWRQLTKFLWPEIRKWSRRLDWDKLGRDPFNERTELLTLSLKLSTGEAFAVASDNSMLIEGAHANNLLYVFDESKAIPDATFDAAEGAFAGAGGDTVNEAYALAISTPGEPNGRFYDIHARKPGFEDWWTRHVTLEETIATGRVSREWAEQRKRQWGADSAVYQNRVLGSFATSEEDGVVPLSHIERANERWLEWKELDDYGRFLTVGVDVARSGSNKTVMALRYEYQGDLIAIDTLRYTSKEDTTQTSGRVMGILSAHGGKAIIDVVGVGAGVVDQTRAAGYKTVAFNAGGKTDFKDKSGELGFSDTRSAAWWNLRELLEQDRIALPPDDVLTGDLTAPKWRVMSGGRIKVESKDEIVKRLGRSTDAADAVIQSVWQGSEPMKAMAW